MFTVGLARMIGCFSNALRGRLHFADVRHATTPRAFQRCDIAVQDGKYADCREHGLLYAFRREA